MVFAEGFFFSPEPVSAVQDFFGHGHAVWFRAFSLLGEPARGEGSDHQPILVQVEISDLPI